jgi:hypothetical protein
MLNFIEPTAQIKKMIDLKIDKSKSGELQKMIINFENPEKPKIKLVCDKVSVDYEGTGLQKFIIDKIKGFLNNQNKKTIEIDFKQKTIKAV